MKTPVPSVATPLKSWLPSAAGRERLLQGGLGEPLLTADWERVLMLHYEVDPTALQPWVPFPLDLHEGRAYVSLVAFTMRDMAPRRGGRWTSWMLRPIATHEFLNVRTYVRSHVGDGPDVEEGIHFLHEWLPSRLAVRLGRPVFGLPYRLGRLRYDHRHEEGELAGCVEDAHSDTCLRYRAPVSGPFAPCVAGSLTEFLMERYSAFTEWLGWKRRFRIWHPPWPQVEVVPEVLDDSLLRDSCPWFKEAQLRGAHYSPGSPAVWMSRPSRI